MSHVTGCTCATCGVALPDLPLDFAYSLPDCVFALLPEERSPRCNADFAELGERKFVRGLLPVPVQGSEEFRYGVWLEVDADTFQRVLRSWNDPDTFRTLTFSGRLANAVEPFGATTLGVEVEVATRGENARPFVVRSRADWLERLITGGWTRQEYVERASGLRR
jgi:hypothetical protein